MADKVVLQCVIERAGDDSTAVAAIREWFDGNLAVLGRQFRKELLSIEERDSSLVRKSDVSCGEPGTPWGRLYLTRIVNGKERNSWRAVGSKEWSKFLGEKEVIHSARLVVDLLDRKGRPGTSELTGGPVIYVDMKVNGPSDARPSSSDHHDRWILLECMVDGETFREVDSSGSVVMFLREFADTYAPVFVEVSDVSGYKTGFENQFRIDSVESILKSRSVLRGYSWITVTSQEIGDKLGGVQALANSGAFHEVAQLRNGGYWLRATEKYDQYQMPEAERVFRALAPALPAGKPRPVRRFEPPHKIVREDAADYR